MPYLLLSLCSGPLFFMAGRRLIELLDPSDDDGARSDEASSLLLAAARAAWRQFRRAEPAIFFQYLGASRRRTPRARVDLKVPDDAYHPDLSNATLRFDLAVGAHRRHAPKSCQKSIRARAVHAAGSNNLVLVTQLLLVVFVAGSAAVTAKASGLEDWLVGQLAALLAVLGGDCVMAVFPNQLRLLQSDINWATAAANFAALLLLLLLRIVEARPWWSEARVGRLGTLVVAKLAASFCGALSGYGAFSDDVATAYGDEKADKPFDLAMANFAVNALTSMVFMGMLQPVLMAVSSKQ